MVVDFPPRGNFNVGIKYQNKFQIETASRPERNTHLNRGSAMVVGCCDKSRHPSACFQWQRHHQRGQFICWPPLLVLWPLCPPRRPTLPRPRATKALRLRIPIQIQFSGMHRRRRARLSSMALLATRRVPSRPQTPLTWPRHLGSPRLGQRRSANATARAADDEKMDNLKLKPKFQIKIWSRRLLPSLPLDMSKRYS